MNIIKDPALSPFSLCRLLLASAYPFLGLVVFTDICGAASLPVPTQAQIDQIAAWLPEKPTGVGASVNDRRAWENAARQPAFQWQVKEASRFAREPIPELNTDELFAQVIKTGRRDIYEKPFRQRTTRLVAFAIAECILNDGTWIPLVEAEVKAILAEKTWGISTQVDERPFGGFDGIVDLASSIRAWNLATIDYWLGGKLRPQIRRAIHDSIRRRILTHYENSWRTGQRAWWWMTSTANWNPVCTSGVLGAALATAESRQERAFYVQAAINSLEYYSGAFPGDGYCNEGIDYWAYGFGCYLTAAETLYQATRGNVNLYAGANTRKMALFLPRLEIIPGVYPAFGDAKPRTSGMPPSLMLLINRRWNMGWTHFDPLGGDMFRGHPLGDRLPGFGIYGFPWPDYPDATRPSKKMAAGSPALPEETRADDKRFFFRDASVLITRLLASGRPAFGLAIKGGKNGGPHSHIDNGSYVVAMNGVPLIADPGMEQYTTKTFGPDRFKSMMMNSWGHSVPWVGKTLQKGGADSEGKIIQTRFTDRRDILKLDLTSGYPVPGMVRLTRTFVFDRVRPSVEVIDEADFRKPVDYGSAVVTLSDWRENGPGKFCIYEKDTAVDVTVTVDSAGAEAGLRIENKVEPVMGMLLYPDIKPTRLGMNLNRPAAHVVMRTFIVPAAAPRENR